MAKKEFNDESLPLEKLYTLLGVKPRLRSPEEDQALQEILDQLRDAKARDPHFLQKWGEKWAKAEAAADPDAYDHLTASDILQDLKKAVSPKHTKHKSPKGSM